MTTTLRIDAEEGHPNKRRRIALACSSCRARKSKCDGRRPICSTCSSLGFSCQYDTSGPVTALTVHQDSIALLEERMRHAESMLQRHEDLLRGHLSGCGAKVAEKTGPPPCPPLHTPISADQVAASIRLDAAAVQDPMSEDAKTDGLAMTFVKEEASTFFGESSNIAFARHLLVAIASANGRTRLADDRVPTSENHVVEVRTSGFGQEHYPSAKESPDGSVYSGVMLPPATEMERLLTIYFSSTASLFPFIHEATFREEYRDFKVHGFTHVRRTWLGLLNAIFAIASHVQLDDEVSGRDRVETAHMYYVRAVSLCGAPSRQTVSLEIVQYLLLIVLYLQGSHQSIQTWGVHGLLVQTAMALGLHAPLTYKHLDPLQRDIRRRTWLTIYCLDQVLSMTFGRPCSISEDRMAVHSVTTATTSLGGEIGSTNLPGISAQFLDVSVELYKIMSRSLEKQYDSNLGRRDAMPDVLSTIQEVGEMRLQLRRWTSSLPLHLRHCDADDTTLRETSGVNRLRAILTLRYHNLNMLIHRPLLRVMLHSLTVDMTTLSEDDRSHLQLAAAHAHEGCSSAEATIDIVHIILTDGHVYDNNLGVWFFTLFYVFAASLVILSRIVWARRWNNVRDDAAIARGQSYLLKVSDALDRLDHGILLVRSCIRYIEYLSSLLESQAVSRTESTAALLTSHSALAHDQTHAEEPSAEKSLASPSSLPLLNDLFSSDEDWNQLFGSEVLNSAFLGNFFPPQ